MASEYLLKKYKDVKPDEPRVLTKAEKRRNWWDYHKWHVVIAIVLALCLADLLRNMLGVGQAEPDYSVAYVGSVPLSEETVEALRSGLAVVSGDLNGDGEVTVTVNQYVGIATGDSDALYYAQAAQVQLVGDIEECASYFFLLEDPAEFQRETMVLCRLDGSLPPEGDDTPDGKYVLWGDCPVLAGIDLGTEGERVSQMAFARRGFWRDKTVENADLCAQLWDTLTEGADLP